MENVIAFGVAVAVLGIVAYLIWTNDLNFEETKKSVDNDQTECWPKEKKQ